MRTDYGKRPLDEVLTDIKTWVRCEGGGGGAGAWGSAAGRARARRCALPAGCLLAHRTDRPSPAAPRPPQLSTDPSVGFSDHVQGIWVDNVPSSFDAVSAPRRPLAAGIITCAGTRASRPAAAAAASHPPPFPPTLSFCAGADRLLRPDSRAAHAPPQPPHTLFHPLHPQALTDYYGQVASLIKVDFQKMVAFNPVRLNVVGFVECGHCRCAPPPRLSLPAHQRARPAPAAARFLTTGHPV